MFFRGRKFFLQGTEIAFLATGHEAFGDRLEFLPPGADGLGFLFGDMIVTCRRGDHRQEIGEFWTIWLVAGTKK